MPLPLRLLRGAAAGGLPTATVAPSISGTPQVGQTLTATSGTWSGGYSGPFTYVWKAGGVVQPTQNASSYYVVESNVGQTITCEVHPSALPSQVASSSATAPVTVPGARTDLKSWTSDARWIYSKTNPIQASENRVTITGGAGWTPGVYYNDPPTYIASFNVSDPPNQAIRYLDRAASAAGASGGQGWLMDGSPVRRVALGGNSMMGYNAEGFVQQYQALLRTRGDYRWDSVQTSLSGWTIDNLESNKATLISGYRSGYQRNIALVWEITNTLYFGQTKETTLSKHQSYCASLKAAGYYVVIMTCMPRSDNGTPAGFEADRLWVNAQLLADTSGTHYNEVLDVCADARLGATGAEMNATWFRDRVHLTQAGFAIVADMVFNLILRR